MGRADKRKDQSSSNDVGDVDDNDDDDDDDDDDKNNNRNRNRNNNNRNKGENNKRLSLETTWCTNHLGHWYLTTSLVRRYLAAMQALGSRAPSPSPPHLRVITVASSAHAFARSAGLDFTDLQWRRREYSHHRVYGDSKLCNILFARELQRRVGMAGVLSVAVHPGIASSSLYDGWFPSGPLAPLEPLRR